LALRTQDLFAADIRDIADEAVPEARIDALYEQHLLEVELAQIEQKAILRCLIKHHGLRRVSQEGVARRDLPIYRAKLKVMRDVAKRVPGLRKEHADIARTLCEMERVDKRDPADFRSMVEIKEKIEELLYAHRLDLLRIGTAGQLQMTGELEDVLPLHDATLLDKANPLAGGKGVTLDSDAIEARQDAQVQKLIKAGGFALGILGGVHDLSDNLDRLSDGKAEYIRVATRRWQEFAVSAFSEESGSTKRPRAPRITLDSTAIPCAAQ
jgi:hypothetical protein